MNTGSIHHGSLLPASASAMVIGIVASILVHISAGIGLNSYLSNTQQQRLDTSAQGAHVIEPLVHVENEEEVKLGLDSSITASIHWLGVLEDAQPGDAVEADVEQAALTTQAGDTDESSAMPAQIPQEPVQENVHKSKPQPADVSAEEAVQEPLEADPEPEKLVPEAQPDTQVIEDTLPIEVPSDLSEPDVVLQPVQEQEEVDQPNADSEEDPVNKPSVETPELVQGEVQEHKQEQKHVQDLAQVPPAEPSSPAVNGKQGELSKKESTASILKRAIDIKPQSLHKPFAGKGIELFPVEPRFPASVRFTQLPRNPVVMLRFDQRGRVIRAWFLKDGRKVFDTGSQSVDEPLLSAMYKWRAKGKQIEELDPQANRNDPKGYVDIPMRIVFRKENDLP